MAFDLAGEMDKIKACSIEKGDDFILRAFRQDSMTSLGQESAATFHGAQAVHFATPEAWIPQFLGGGYYRLIALHMTDPTTPVGSVSGINITGAKKVPPDFAAIDRDDWQGPRALKYPKREVQQAVTGLGPFTAVPGSGAAPTGGADARGQFPGGGAGASSEIALVNMQRQHDAENLRQMLDAQAKATERQFTAMMKMVETIANRPVPVPPPEKSLIEQVAPLVAAFTPLVTIFVGQRSDDAKAALERESRREERAAVDRAEAMKMLTAMSEKAQSASGDMLKVVSPMVDAVSQMGRTVLQNVTMLREIQGEPPEEEGLTGVLKEGIRALGPALGDWLAAKEAAKAASAPRPPQAPQLPAHPQNGATASQAAAPAPQGGDPDDPTDDGETAPDFATTPAADLIEGLDRAIREHLTIAELAPAYLDARTKNAGVAAAVNASGGTIPFFQAKLGSQWLMDAKPGKDGQLNSTYIRALLGALTTTAQQRGIAL